MKTEQHLLWGESCDLQGREGCFEKHVPNGNATKSCNSVLNRDMSCTFPLGVNASI